MSAWVRGNLLWKGRIFKKKSEIPQNDFTKPNIEGLFCASIPLAIFSPEKGVRGCAGCICYPIFIIVALAAFFNNAMSVFWGVIIAIVILLLLNLGRICYEKEQKAKDRQIANKFEAALSKQCSDLFPDEYPADNSKK